MMPSYDPKAHQDLRDQIEYASNRLSTCQNKFQSLLDTYRSIESRLNAPTGESNQLNPRIISAEKQISSLEGARKSHALRKLTHAKTLTAFSAAMATNLADLERTAAARGCAEKKHDLAAYWKQHLQDTATAQGAFLTHCRAAYVQHINALLPGILAALCADRDGLRTTQTLLAFRLTSDFWLAATRSSRG